jgi:hypothetical protein
MQSAHQRPGVRSSTRHPLRTAVIVGVLVALAAVYFGGSQGIETGFDLSWITERIFG